MTVQSARLSPKVRIRRSSRYAEHMLIKLTPELVSGQLPLWLIANRRVVRCPFKYTPSGLSAHQDPRELFDYAIR